MVAAARDRLAVPLQVAEVGHAPHRTHRVQARLARQQHHEHLGVEQLGALRGRLDLQVEREVLRALADGDQPRRGVGQRAGIEEAGHALDRRADLDGALRDAARPFEPRDLLVGALKLLDGLGLGVVDAGQARPDHGVQVFAAQLPRTIDPDGHVGAAARRLRDRVLDQCPGAVLLARGDAVFEVEADGVRAPQVGLLDECRHVDGHDQRRSPHHLAGGRVDRVLGS